MFTFKYITYRNSSINAQVFPYWPFHKAIQKLLIRLIDSKQPQRIVFSLLNTAVGKKIFKNTY